MKERGLDIRRLRLTAICTVCTRAFVNEVKQMNDLITELGPPGDRAGRGRLGLDRAAGSGVTHAISPRFTLRRPGPGGGIAGLEAALNLAEQDFSVAVVEKDSSIGGKMIRLSKVFPDPGLLQLYHHAQDGRGGPSPQHHPPHLTASCNRWPARGTSWWRRSAKSPATWTRRSASAAASANIDCPVLAPDAEQGGFAGRKAIYIPFTNAIPQKALIDPETASCAADAPRSAPPGRSTTFRSRRISP